MAFATIVPFTSGTPPCTGGAALKTRSSGALSFAGAQGWTNPALTYGLGDTDGDGFGDGSLTGICRGEMGCGGFGQLWVVFVRGGSDGWSGPPTNISAERLPLGDVNGDGYADTGERAPGGLAIRLGGSAGLSASPVRVIP